MVAPGIRARITASDNVDLLPDATKRSGQLYELMPYVTARVNTPRAVGEAFYGLRGQIRNGGIDDRNELRNDLRAFGDLELVDNAVRLYGRVSVFDVNTSPFGASSFDPATQRTNRSQYRDLELSPYTFGRFGSEGEWTVRYGLRYVDPGASVQSNTIQSLFGQARSTAGRGPVGWLARTDSARVAYQAGLDYDSSNLDLLGTYRFDTTLLAGLGVGYSRNDILFNDRGENSGWGASAFVEWLPGPRTQLRARWSDRYWGNAAEVRALHRAARWTFGLDFFDQIRDGNTAGLNGYNTAALFTPTTATGAPSPIGTNPIADGLVNQNLLSPTGTTFGVGAINSPLVFTRSAIGSVGWIDGRSSLLGTAFLTNRRTAVAFTNGSGNDIDQYGGSLTYAYSLDPRNVASLTGRRTYSENNIDGSTSTLDAALLTWLYRLSPQANAALSGRLQRQRGDGTTVRYDEAALTATLDYRF